MKYTTLAAVAALSLSAATYADDTSNQSLLDACEDAVRAELNQGHTRFTVDDVDVNDDITTVVMNVRHRPSVTARDRTSQINRRKASTAGNNFGAPTGPGAPQPTSFAPGIKKVTQLTATCVVVDKQMTLTLE